MKSNLIQITYISRSTFLAVGSPASVEPQVAKILSKSKTNNRKNGLAGVLFFGDGCFFECLEGAEENVEALYQNLLKDSRHKDLKVISRKKIIQPSFQKWSMKYVPFDAEIKRLLTNSGFKTFDPYSFNQDMVIKMLDLLLIADDQASKNDTKNVSKLVVYLPAIILAIYLMNLVISFNVIK